jgi:hypothetical protein
MSDLNKALNILPNRGIQPQARPVVEQQRKGLFNWRNNSSENTQSSGGNAVDNAIASFDCSEYLNSH